MYYNKKSFVTSDKDKLNKFCEIQNYWRDINFRRLEFNKTLKLNNNLRSTLLCNKGIFK